MSTRSYPRLRGPFPGHWRTGRGPFKPCQLSAISMSGCFVNTQRTPLPGAAVEVSLDLEGKPELPVAATVVNAEWGFGFGVKFNTGDAAQRQALKGMLDTLRHRRE